jgi:pilus assembly protein CpaE
VPRSVVAIALPRPEFLEVDQQLTEAGYECIAVPSAADLDELLAGRPDVNLAILDCETEFDRTLEMYAILHENGRNVPALILMPSRSLGRMGLGGVRDEYFTRPYSAESLRWRVEAMLIRVENLPVDGEAVSGMVGGPQEPGDAAEVGWGDDPSPDEARAGDGKIVIVFNPKGGVGKTTISINVGAALQIRKGQRVLLVDCDTITGHIAASLGLERPRTLADAWREDAKTGVSETVSQIATRHSSGISVLVMAQSPLHTEVLEPQRVAAAIIGARRFYDWVILDMHPDYGPLNQALFAQADKILVPVTPDVPCIRAAVQFREVAAELGLQERLMMVINRANSGVAASDVERVMGVPTLGRVRSAGMLFVRAADEGRAAVERFPTAKVVGDIDSLANRLMDAAQGAGDKPGMSPRSRIAESIRGLFDRMAAQVS